MRIVSWNIRAGGGTRALQIAQQLEDWRPSVVVLCEFRGTPPSQALASRLAQIGLAHQRSTVAPQEPAKNAGSWWSRPGPSRIRTGNCGFRAQMTLRLAFVSVAKFGGSVSLPIRLSEG